MVATSVITAIAASKWVLVGRILTAVGGGLVTASPILNKAVKSKRVKKNKGGEQ